MKQNQNVYVYSSEYPEYNKRMEVMAYWVWVYVETGVANWEIL